MKKILLVVSASIFLLFGAHIFAVEKNDVKAGTKMGVIDLNKILMESPQLKKAKVDLKKKFDAEEKKMMADQKKFQDMIKDFQKLSEENRKNGPTMTPTQKKEAGKKESDKQEEIVKEQQRLQKMQAKFQEDIGKAQNDVMQGILKNVENIVKKTAQAKNFDMVVTKTSVAYNKEELDITSDIIKELKKKIPAPEKKK